PFKELINNPPMYFMVQKDLSLNKIYSKGFALNDIYNLNSLGLLTKRDKFITDFEKNSIVNKLNDFIETNHSDEALARKYNLKLKDKDKWDLAKSRKEIQKTGIIQANFRVQNYRCFDKRFIYYDNNFVARLNTKVLGHLSFKNISIISTRQLADDNFNHIFVSNIISDQCFISNKTKEGCQVFPLYLYPKANAQQTIDNSTERTPNLNPEIVKQIAENLGLTFTNEKENTQNTFAPIDILDYIYAVLHSPTYREKFKEFLKIDFPRVPYPKDKNTFWQLVKLGGEIRQIHLLESPTVEQYITQYPIDGDNVVSRKITKGSPGYVADNETHGKVYINDEQYFDNVPLTAWEFYIGGYQPAQKWLKDRKNRTLSFDDILHYQKIIVALSETDRLMKEIDKIEFMETANKEVLTNG
ncbi:MAG: hypothetical protein PHW82_16675, partial [Bacteroidales bacterium]|nr:hypothetical protein [Bacteroidales bacterium]